MAIVTRDVKGSPLTHTEMDTNFKQIPNGSDSAITDDGTNITVPGNISGNTFNGYTPSKLNGDNTERFKVADALADDEALSKGQAKKHFILMQTNGITVYDGSATEVNFATTLSSFGAVKSGTGAQVKRAGRYLIVCNYVYSDVNGIAKGYLNINGSDHIALETDVAGALNERGSVVMVRDLNVNDIIKFRVVGDASWDDDGAFYLSIIEQ